MSPYQEQLYAVIKNNPNISLTTIFSKTRGKSIGATGNSLGLLEKEGFITLKDCPTCGKNGVYNVTKRPLS